MGAGSVHVARSAGALARATWNLGKTRLDAASQYAIVGDALGASQLPGPARSARRGPHDHWRGDARLCAALRADIRMASQIKEDA